ncbi:MAG: CDP-alcohol phosphatidyltransferase family protein [Candidatus Gastranaerophilales bacterium]|nr:CDP-alcohol phosphatidyltransferase family protein [Candidatus Gastranaerophilales bacterium]
MANLLTILRMILAIVAIELLFTGRPDFCMSAILITLFVIILDGLDGYAARKLNESSKFGSVFDIIGDRVVENIYWIVFAVFGWVGVWVPLVVVTRGIITDGLRSIALAKGYTAFGDSTMMKNPVFKFLTASRFSRALYGSAKALAFLAVMIAHLPNFEYYDGISTDAFVYIIQFQPHAIITANILVYITVAMCVIRGIPVIIESKQYINENNQ